MLKVNKEKLIILMLFIIIFLLVNFSVSKYRFLITENGKAVIAEPIIIFEKGEVINTEYNKKSGELEFAFKIKNYLDDSNINEVDFMYNLEIKETNTNFPISYKLIDVTNNEEIILTNNISSNFFISKGNKEEDSYKLIINWDESKNLSTYSDNLGIDLKANIVQLYS